MKPRNFLTAVVGADNLESEEISRQMEALGLDKDQVHFFGLETEMTVLDVQDDEARILLPLEESRFEEVYAALLLTADEKARQSVLGWASRHNFWVFDFLPGREDSCVDPKQSKDALTKLGPVLNLADPDAFHCAALVEALEQWGPKSLYCHSFLPASTLGEPGVRELFQQSTHVLNFKQVDTAVFGRQMAFNFFPVPPDAAAARRLSSDLEALAGFKGESGRIMFRFPVFHCAALSVMVEVEGAAGAAVKGAASVLRKNEALALAGPKSWPSPLENAAVGKPAVKLQAAGPHHVWAWVLYDHLKAGKVSQALTMLSTLSKEG